MPLDGGMYRVEFTCWISDAAALPADGWICTVDVLNIETGFLAEKRISKADLQLRKGWISDIFFSVDSPGKGTFEFRVHTSGAVDLFVRQIKLRRYSRRPDQAWAKRESIEPKSELEISKNLL